MDHAPQNRLATPTHRRGGRPSAAEVIARAQPEAIPLGQAVTCRRCGRGRMRVNGAPRVDGGRPLRCSHCSATATLLADGKVQWR